MGSIEARYFQALWLDPAPRAGAPQLDSSVRSIRPGQRVGGFSVTMAEPDAAYLTATAIVTYGDTDIDVMVKASHSLQPDVKK